ncbi:DUF6118 family protein [Allosphingosinicella humi]
MALVRRAVEKLAAERADIVIPDYSTTLGEIAQRLAATAQGIKTLAAQPAMRITPDEMASRIDTAAVKARRSDHVAIAEAQGRFDQASHDLRAIVRSARAADAQRRHINWTAAGGVLAGILLWAIVPGVLARSAPQSWLWPEHMAARMLRLDPWGAGERLLSRAHPRRWETVLFANSIVQENSDAITDCLRAAEEAARPQRCTIMILPGDHRKIPREDSGLTPTQPGPSRRQKPATLSASIPTHFARQISSYYHTHAQPVIH